MGYFENLRNAYHKGTGAGTTADPFVPTVALDQTTPGTTNAVSVANQQITTASVTVSNGQSLSSAVDLGSALLAGIQTPSAMDSATSLTFQVSYDATTYANFYDSSGTEYTVTVSTSRSVLLPAADFIGVRAIKVRLGTSGSPVTATADRTFTIAKRP